MKFDAIRFCEDHGIPYWGEGKNLTAGWIGVTCPFCSDTSNHGGFNTANGYYHCWKCGGHPTYDVIKKFTGVSNPKQILRRYGVIHEGQAPKNERKKKDFILPGETPLKKIHIKYLEQRGFDPEYLEMKYFLRGTDHIGQYKFRIVIPVVYNQKVVSFITRDATNQQEFRYMTCPGNMEIIEHKNILFNSDNCPGKRAIGVEGVFDVFRIGDNCFGTFGTAFTPSQIKEMQRFEKVFLLYDTEPEAQEKAEKALYMLNSVGIDTELITLDGGDPAEMSDDDVIHLKKDLRLY